jgi:sugar/nucleoside kinase (ribokinase family)
MSIPILLAGTIGIDTLITPTDRADNVLGGSASFAGVAAALYADQIDIVSIIGNDFPNSYEETLKNHNVCLDHVTRYDGPSFAWTGEYFDNMNKRRTVTAKDEVMVNWDVTVPECLQHHRMVVASCMVPAGQLRLLSQCQSPELVLTDSMDKWITRQPDLLDAVMRRSHIVLMNEDEAKAYAHTPNIIEAGEYMLSFGPRYSIIKQGEYGAVLFGKATDCRTQLFRCPAWPLRQVIDPTGAGDSFLGALAGYLSQQNDLNPSFEVMKQGIVLATVVASFTCESFSADALLAIDKATIEKRFHEYRQLTAW